jgi:hypothetical protein
MILFPPLMCSVGSLTVAYSFKKSCEYQKPLLASGAVILCCLLLTQIYASIRYGVFPARPLAVIRSLPSSYLLKRSFGGHSGDVHPIPLSVNAPSFANFNSVAVTPDGQKFVSGSGDGAINFLLSLWENLTDLRYFSPRQIKVSPQFDRRGLSCGI